MEIVFSYDLVKKARPLPPLVEIVLASVAKRPLVPLS